ncbi:MAG: hypothetical protein ACLRYY_04845 [Anaerobutyricum soehngenii]
MPALLAAALLMGITSVLGGMEVVKTHDTLYAINRLVSLAATGIFCNPANGSLLFCCKEIWW